MLLRASRHGKRRREASLRGCGAAGWEVEVKARREMKTEDTNEMIVRRGVWKKREDVRCLGGGSAGATRGQSLMMSAHKVQTLHMKMRHWWR